MGEGMGEGMGAEMRVWGFGRMLSWGVDGGVLFDLSVGVRGVGFFWAGFPQFRGIWVWS